ncbi:hypothetical protein [Nocardiopsis sp. MG754419]|uniref:hypothetical protein n=1 Tax=Nocardiopsis sp. MG754419 TaxID=2259865 RepID=UPI001BA63FD6|nr:hypothetical protein [Nocardiopsis sp. MG754419]MBR8742161.1 hypothetical protein [Nocardiopsis sp. MG754419]
MTDNGGGEPGNRSSEEDADSWFKPSENRFRKQSDYQDPMEHGGEPESDASGGASAVFPDSGGYAGLSASRPALVEPYPDALGAPPTPPANPEPQGPPGLSYPGAGTGAYRPVTRIPGEQPPAWENPDSSWSPSSSSGWGADTGAAGETPAEASSTVGEWGVGDTGSSAAPAWDAPAEPRDPAEPLWPAGTTDLGSAADSAGAVPPADQGTPSHDESSWDRWDTRTPETASWNPEPAEPTWGTGSITGSEWGTGSAPDVDHDRPETSVPSGGYPGIAASAQVPLPPEGPEEHGSLSAPDTWGTSGNDSWSSGSVDGRAAGSSTTDDRVDPYAWGRTPGYAGSESNIDDPLTGPRGDDRWDTSPYSAEETTDRRDTDGLDSWSPTPDTGDDWKGAGTTEPWTEPDAAGWVDPAPSYLEDRRYTDDRFASGEETGTERARESYEPYDELSAPSSSATPAHDDGLGGGTGNTWAFDRNDPRLPDVVREAERRRRDEADPEPSGFDEWRTDREDAPETGRPFTDVAGSDDPLAAIADLQSRAKAREDEDRRSDAHASDRYAEPTWGEDDAASADPFPTTEAPSWSRGAEGATQIFSTSDFGGASSGYGSDARSAAPYDELGFDGRGADGHGRDDGPSGARDTDGYDELGYYDRGYADAGYGTHGDAGHDESGLGARGYEDSGYAGSGYGGSAFDQDHDDRGYDDRDYDDRGYDDRGYDEDDESGYDDRSGGVAAGVPSDLGSPFGSSDRDTADAWNGADADPDVDDDERDRRGDDVEDPDYDDGFTPADYGMTDRPKASRRRRDRIAEDFPGFEDRPLGGEAGDAYPGYDSVDFLADTDPGAVRTLWLGVASLIPVLGVITAILALFVTGPKAKKTIRRSRGALDGLGLITTGTVFAVLGILVTVISVALWLFL